MGKGKIDLRRPRQKKPRKEKLDKRLLYGKKKQTNTKPKTLER